MLGFVDFSFVKKLPVKFNRMFSIFKFWISILSRGIIQINEAFEFWQDDAIDIQVILLIILVKCSC